MEELDKYRVWEFEHRYTYLSEPDNDSTVHTENGRRLEYARPLPDAKDLDDEDDTIYLITTRFTLADGTVFTGISSPCDPSGLDYEQPIIFTENGLVRLWYDWVPSWNEPERSLERLQRSSGEVFPIRVEALVPCENGWTTPWYKRTVDLIWIAGVE